MTIYDIIMLICLVILLLVAPCLYFPKRKKSKVKPVIEEKPVEDKSLLGQIRQNKCPDCGKGGEGMPYQFLMGPCGGASMNIKCRDCGSKFNVAPMDDDYRLWEIFFVERIS